MIFLVTCWEEATLLWWTLRKLTAGNTEARQRAAQELGSSQDPRAVGALLEAIVDADSLVRQAAARALGGIGNTRAIEPLALALKDDEVGVRRCAAEALGEMPDDRATEALMAALADTDTGVRAPAERILPRTRREWRASDAARRAAPFLVLGLRSTDYKVRQAAAETLGLVGHSLAVGPLVEALTDGSAGQRVWDALARIDPNWRETDAARNAIPSLVAALRGDGSASDRCCAATALGEITDPSRLETLVAALGDKVWMVREAAAEALGRIADTRAAEALAAASEDANPSVKLAAALALARIADDRAIAPLVAASLGYGDTEAEKALEGLDPNWRRTEGATQGISALVPGLVGEDEFKRLRTARTLDGIDPDWPARASPTQCIPPLVAKLNDALLDVRLIAASTLDCIDPDWRESQAAIQAVPSFLKGLDSTDPSVREYAAEALAEIADSRAFDRLVAALKCQKSSADRAAARGLGRIGDARAVKPLLAHTHGLGFKHVAEALVAIGDPDAVEPLIEWLSRMQSDQDVALAAEVLPRLDPGYRTSHAARRAVPPFLAMLSDASSQQAVGLAQPHKRAHAVMVLGVLGESRVVEPLLAALHDDDSRVLVSAAWALGAIGDARAVEPLMAALRNGSHSLRKVAAEALGKVRDVRAIPPLHAALKDEEDLVRHEAALALARFGDEGVAETFIREFQDEGCAWDRRSQAAYAISNIAQSGTAETLLRALDAGEWRMRQTAAKVLAEVTDAQMVGLLAATLENGCRPTRYESKMALRRLRTKWAADAVIQAMAAGAKHP